MPISDLDGLQERPLRVVFDDAQGDTAWLFATATLAEEGIPSFSCWDPLPYYSVDRREPTEAVRRLVLALQNGEVLVEAIDTQTHERVRLPPGFWWGWILGKDGTAATLQALQGGRRVRPVYLDPRLVIPQPETEPKRLVWRIAEELLSAGEGPPRGHGRQIRLARMVQPKLKAAGYGDLKDNTVADYLRDSLREWEAKHPG
jgi:hypothetical protein